MDPVITPSMIISAIIGAIRAVPIIDGWFQKLIVAYIDGQTNETKCKIVDAAALAARAETDEERYEASKAWMVALSRPRVSK